MRGEAPSVSIGDAEGGDADEGDADGGHAEYNAPCMFHTIERVRDVERFLPIDVLDGIGWASIDFDWTGFKMALWRILGMWG